MASTSSVTMFASTASSFSFMLLIGYADRPNVKRVPHSRNSRLRIPHSPILSPFLIPQALPPARRQPLLDLVQAVGAPERLIIDDDVRRTENPACDRRIDFAP